MSISRAATAVLLAATVFGTFLLSIPAAEIAFRLAGDEPSPDLAGLFAPFRNGTYKVSPSLDTYAIYTDGRLAVHTDALGLRCDEARHFGTKAGDKVDVLVMGDSQGFGNGVNFEQSIAGTFAGMIAEQGYRLSNASVGGHGLANQIDLAQWLIDEQRLNVSNFVLLLTPAMIFSGRNFTHAIVGADKRLYDGAPGWRTRANVWAKTNSVVYLRIRDAVRNLGIGVDPSKASSSVFMFYDQGKDAEPVLEALLEGVEKLKAFSTAHGATLHLVYVPLTIEADFDPVRKAAAKTGLDLDPDLPLRIASSVANRLQLPFYSLKPVLQEVASKGKVLNVRGDFHYSSVLSQAAGSALAANLKFSSKEILAAER